MFKKILVANRGEIARRIFLACRELNITCAAVYSEADAGASWVRMADEGYPLKGFTATESYLNQEQIFRAAKICEADAIHPGYGFLSENPEFAAACDRNGIAFIGPSVEAMRALGSKATARKLAEEAGVPVVPGVDGADLSDGELQTAAAAIGYPVLIKASAGGGGKGMRVVWEGAEFLEALQYARKEARASFGDDHVLLEKYLTEIHHVEIQVLGDQQGHLLHLYERECSIQRRHQKIIEESPAPVIQDDRLRQEMANAAVRLARTAGYTNAGTVEFVVDGQGKFYFLEMNTRLQVEHPVTELVTGLDLVTWQIRVAAGEILTLQQTDINQRGHAIECRVYAEDPANHFLPSTGKLSAYRPPSGPGVRIDDGIEKGAAITPYYDPMLAKVITWGLDRPEAVRKMVRALKEMVVLGVTTNIPYLLAILAEPAFLTGDTPTSYLEQHFMDWQAAGVEDEAVLLAAAVLEMLQGRDKRGGRRRPEADEGSSQIDPWQDSAILA